MSVSGEDHREAVAVGGLYDFVVADGASGLDDRAYSGVGQSLHTVGEREEGIAGSDGPVRLLAGLLYGYLRGVDPAHPARSDPDRGPVPGQDYRVTLDHAGHAPDEEQVIHLL